MKFDPSAPAPKAEKVPGKLGKVNVEFTEMGRSVTYEGWYEAGGADEPSPAAMLAATVILALVSSKVANVTPRKVAEVIDAALEDERAAWADEAQREILLRALGRK